MFDQIDSDSRHANELLGQSNLVFSYTITQLQHYISVVFIDINTIMYHIMTLSCDNID